MLKNQEVQIRDPFVYVDREAEKYYLFGSTDKNIWGKGTGFDMYQGTDLENWDGPFPVFQPDENFYSDENFWAPEIHRYKGKFYMFATFLRKDNGKRGTGILIADKVEGPYVQHSDTPVTPEDWFSLDGTFYLDENEDPWLVFCREWVQVEDGEIHAVRLSDDLKEAKGAPVKLFSASEAAWPTSFKHRTRTSPNNYVTDGPFVFETSSGELLLLWASFIDNVYAQGISRSVSKSIEGPWEHYEEPLYMNDGGHGMIFKSLEDELYLTLHSPNKTPEERPIFIPIEEKGKKIQVKK